MRTWMIGLTIGAAAVMSAGEAAAQCCAGHGTPQAQATHQHEGGPAMPCCQTHAAPTPDTGCCTAAADDPKVALAGLGLANPLPVKTMSVVFREPVRVGDNLLMGWYVIEHDDDRMARGEPCTYIYELDTMRDPVATFHCTHLEHPAPDTATVVLGRTAHPSVKTLLEFQFSGEAAAHGVPGVR